MKIKKNGFEFDINNKILTKYIDLIKLILGSESINNFKKQELFQELKTMKNKDINQLYNIFKDKKNN